MSETVILAFISGIWKVRKCVILEAEPQESEE